MDKKRIGFLLVAVAAMLIAGLLTWSLLNPKEVGSAYQYSFGSLPQGPQQEAVGKAMISFKKTEDNTNG